MIEDQIAVFLKEIAKLKGELKDIKKDLKQEEAIDTDEYRELNKTYKDLKAQVKGIQEEWQQSLLKDESYQQLREMKLKKEEEIAEASQKMFEAIAKLPPKYHQWNVDMENGPVRIQVQPEMRIYLNGKEEKKRG